MSTDLGVDFFIRFDNLNPSAQKRCIFFVKKVRADRRCQWDCQDKQRAIELHQIITESDSGQISIDDIIEYILCNCCARARHREAIVDVDLLRPLAERWLDEIRIQRELEKTQSHAANLAAPTTPASMSWTSNSAPSSYVTSATSTPSRTITIQTPLTSPSYHRSVSPLYSKIESKTDASPTPAPRVASAISISNAAQLESPSLANRTRYYLRSHDDRPVTNPVSRYSALLSLFEFKPHITEPSPEDSVSSKLREPLSSRDFRRDFKMGSVYIYNRTSSPGHVKIGWTSKSVEDRLEEWSKCGYTPVELFRVAEVPYAQRVETLTHHELIKEWRRERPCKGCLERKGERVCHQEWFEVSPERAMQVLGTWAAFFKKAKPYESDGTLKAEWKRVVDVLDKEGEIITSARILEHHEPSFKKEATVQVGCKALPSQTPLIGMHGHKMQEQPKTHPKVMVASLPKTGEHHTALHLEPFIFQFGSPSQAKSWSNNSPLLVEKSLAKWNPILKTEPLPEGAMQSNVIWPTKAPKSVPSKNERIFIKQEPGIEGSPLTQEPLAKIEPIFGALPPFEMNVLSKSE